MSIQINRVNAFSQKSNGGNLAGVVLDASDLSDSQMQAIATKVGASETAFILPSKTETYRLRFFTPITEVSMCGHATIAAWYLLAQNEQIEAGRYTQETGSGRVMIEVTDGRQIFMAMSNFDELGIVRPMDLTECLGLSIEEISADFEPQIISSDLVIKLKSPLALETMRPNFQKMIELSELRDFYAFHVFCDSEELGVLAIVRSFAPRVGINEDAATGTGNSDMLYLLLKRNLLTHPEKVHKIKQGELIGYPSCILGRVEGETVWVGGDATLLESYKEPNSP